MTAREYLEKRKSAKLLEAINKSSAAAETAAEQRVRQKSKKRYGRTVLMSNAGEH
jgi:hypothetical protein